MAAPRNKQKVNVINFEDLVTSVATKSDLDGAFAALMGEQEADLAKFLEAAVSDHEPPKTPPEKKGKEQKSLNLTDGDELINTDLSQFSDWARQGLEFFRHKCNKAIVQWKKELIQDPEKNIDYLLLALAFSALHRLSERELDFSQDYLTDSVIRNFAEFSQHDTSKAAKETMARAKKELDMAFNLLPKATDFIKDIEDSMSLSSQQSTEAKSASPMNEDLTNSFMTRGKLAHDSGNHAKATDIFTRIINNAEIVPTDYNMLFEAYVLRAVSYYALNNFMGFLDEITTIAATTIDGWKKITTLLSSKIKDKNDTAENIRLMFIHALCLFESGDINHAVLCAHDVLIQDNLKYNLTRLERLHFLHALIVHEQKQLHPRPDVPADSRGYKTWQELMEINREIAKTPRNSNLYLKKASIYREANNLDAELLNLSIEEWTATIWNKRQEVYPDLIRLQISCFYRRVTETLTADDIKICQDNYHAFKYFLSIMIKIHKSKPIAASKKSASKNPPGKLTRSPKTKLDEIETSINKKLIHDARLKLLILIEKLNSPFLLNAEADQNHFINLINRLLLEKILIDVRTHSTTNPNAVIEYCAFADVLIKGMVNADKTKDEYTRRFKALLNPKPTKKQKKAQKEKEAKAASAEKDTLTQPAEAPLTRSNTAAIAFALSKEKKAELTVKTQTAEASFTFVSTPALVEPAPAQEPAASSPLPVAAFAELMLFSKPGVIKTHLQNQGMWGAYAYSSQAFAPVGRLPLAVSQSKYECR